jgi:outer membrane protein
MTLDEALAYARANNPQVAAENARVALRNAQAKEPDARWSPRFGATAQALLSSNNNSAANWLGSGATELPRIAGTGFLQRGSQIDWKPYVSTTVGLTGVQELFDFGRIAAETAAADAVTDVARARRDDVRLAVELGIRESYQAVLTGRAVADIARGAVARAKVHKNDAHARVAQGLRSRIEEERADADVARFEVSVVRAEGSLRSAQAAYAATVGVKSPLLDVTGAGPAPTPIVVPTIDQALADAARTDPALRAAVLQVRAAREQRSAVEAQRRPELWAIGTVNSAAGGAPRENTNDQTWGYGAVPWIPDYFGGVVLAWRFFDPVIGARAASARQEEQVAAADVTAVQQERIAQVQRAWIALDVAVRALPALERTVTAARANWDQADVRFNSGLGTSVELADAESLRVVAELEHEQGRFEAERARAQLTRFTGGTQ